MSDIYRDRHAKLGCMVLKLFPKFMQMILKYYETPPGLKQKYLKQHFCFVFTEKEIDLMDKLPNMNEFTIELCYKILRSENRLDEPKCKWGNVPHVTEVEISDDIQRLINATNSIKNIKSQELTEKYLAQLLEEIRLIATRGDSFLQQDTLESMYNSLCRSETDSIDILQDLIRIKAIDEAEFLPDTGSEKRERYSRLSMAFIDTFPNILRDIIRSNISASDLYLRCINYIGYFNPEQQANLRQLQYSSTYSSLDVTLIYRLLRQFQLIPPPTQGWGAIPNKADTKLADDIERIRCYRNQVAHRCDTNIDANVFDDYFDKFQNIGRRMDLNFFQKTNFEQQIIGHRTSRIDTEMLKKYENAMKEKELIQLRFEKKPIKFYWGESFNKCLKNLRSLFKDEQSEGRQKIRVQIIFQSEDDVERNIHILNSLKDEINEGLHGIEFIVATKGSVVLIVDILLEMLETDEKFHTTLALFLEKILELIMTFTTETIDMVLSPVEEYMQWNEAKTIREPVYLEFDIEAQLFETDDIMEEQLGKITDVIFKRSNGSGTNNSITGAILPFYLESMSTKEACAQAQTPEGKLDGRLRLVTC
ncbi:uncharacterized protein LOC127707295 [Mytilus californianus]|uniref:uncharacterized protein LOC127707295 n=1 Tax=Mytilus californianus TaxID=6549 RepID=UPI0022452207|nr:uncharacterized protein LOC127707295 [Mytilus californianus]XP_052067788.1 uncharacterized protein LOC127707295 [Mytilus californianus]XP_052067789.1 uncharacterized protein LOC127707295 [Mytilus californianus]